MTDCEKLVKSFMLTESETCAFFSDEVGLLDGPKEYPDDVILVSRTSGLVGDDG
jgi:hypothetical protein